MTMKKKSVILEGAETMAFLASDMPVIPQAERYTAVGAVDCVTALLEDAEGNPVDLTLSGATGTIKRLIRKGGFTDDDGNRCYDSAQMVEVPVVVEGLSVKDVLRRLMEMAGNSIDIDEDIPEVINLADVAAIPEVGERTRSIIPQEYKNVAVQLRRLITSRDGKEAAKVYSASYVVELSASNEKIASMVEKERARLTESDGLSELGL